MFILVSLIIVAIILALAILLQGKGGGLGVTLPVTGSYHTRRGLEKSLFYLTLGLTLAFTGLSILALR